MEGSPDAAAKHPSGEALEGILFLGRKMVSFSWQKADEHLPQLKSSVNNALEKSKEDLLPFMNKAAEYAAESVKEGVLPHAKKGVNFVVDNTKEHVVPLVNKAAEYASKTVQEDVLPLAKKGVNFVVENTKEHVLPFVKMAAADLVESVKEHPSMYGFVGLLVLLYYLPKPGSLGKMMKAPGRGGQMMLRSVFESNPKGYFRDLRGKGL